MFGDFFEFFCEKNFFLCPKKFFFKEIYSQKILFKAKNKFVTRKLIFKKI